MMVRTDIVAMLRAGHSGREIARQLHVDTRTVSEIRERLGIAKVRPGPKPTLGPQTLFRKHSRPTETGGHLEWTGRRNHGVPMIRWDGQTTTAARIAFIARHEREPVGYVRATCGYPGCVAPGHVEDRPMRERNEAVFDAIFGGSRKPATCGTNSGYAKHLRDNTVICDPCRQAHRDADWRLRNTGTTKATA